ncbi:hypothetical protein [Dietzia sp. MNB45]|uniref:hypothetical protein n=1 Tax=Dietzia sp. MNB45 TaxID=3238800 RepID=UPI003F7E969D
MIAVEYERVFGEQAEKRVGGRPRKGEEPAEILPEVSPDAGRRKESVDEAGDLFNVSGRTVRDAYKAP